MADKLHLMEVFAAVAEARSFAQGARRLNLSAPAVTRAVTELEQHLGVKLLTRTTRQVQVTEAGQSFLAHVYPILAKVQEAEDAAQGQFGQPRGHLVVTAPVMFGRIHVTPLVIAFLAAYPDVAVSTQYLDRTVNLMEEGIDVAIRIGQLADSSLVAARVGSIRRIVCAAPTYLAQHQPPRAPEDLERHVIVNATSVSGGDWRFAEGERTVHQRVSPRLSINSNDAAIDAALAGLGVVQLLSYQVASQLASGQLVRLLQAWETPALPVHVIHREGRSASAKVQAFVQLAVAELRANPALAFQ